MSDTEQIFFTAIATLTGGIILFVLGELLRVTIIIPIQKLKEQIQSALDRVDYHCNILTNFFPEEPSPEQINNIREIKRDLRTTATKLNSKYAVIPYKDFLAKLKIIPTSERIGVAYKGLIFLHNSILYNDPGEIVTNRIDINNTEIDRVKCALTNQDIPPIPKIKERSS